MTYYNRRQFISRSTLGFAGATLGLSMLGHTTAQAANTGGYKALVSIMLKGGMDCFDTVLPYDRESFDAFKSLREGIFANHNADADDSSRNRANLLPLTVADGARFNGRRFALPRELSGLHSLYESGEAAIVANVGPLIEPVTRDGIRAGTSELPKRIFSHNDQQSTWMALGTEGVRRGWGGQFVDAALRADPSSDPLYAALTSSSPDVFLAGELARPFRVPGIGQSVRLDTDNARRNLGRGDDADQARAKLSAYMRKQAFGHTNTFRRDASRLTGRGIDNQILFTERVEAATPLTTVFPNTRLGRQLGGIAQALSLRDALGNSRQVFYAVQGGYDTHDTQGGELPGLHQELDDALVAFRAALMEMGIYNDVTTFTMSDFGRSMVGNGDGTDHGWGGHHFVMGGSVRGGTIYGDVPEVDLAHPQYTDARGRLIPTTSVEQHAATLGRWFGLDEGELSGIFPNLSRFETNGLGFV